MASQAVAVGLESLRADAPMASTALTDGAFDVTPEASAPSSLPPLPMGAAVPLPPSRIPAAFHVRDESGRLRFVERPVGDADIGFADTLGMLEVAYARREQAELPLGAARWGVLQMHPDMWCDRGADWDIISTRPSASRILPPLAAMVAGCARVSHLRDELDVERMRSAVRGTRSGSSRARSCGAEAQRQSLQHRLKQLGRMASLEEERTLAAARAATPKGSSRRLRGCGRNSRRSRTRQAHAKNTSLPRPACRSSSPTRACSTSARARAPRDDASQPAAVRSPPRRRRPLSMATVATRSPCCVSSHPMAWASSAPRSTPFRTRTCEPALGERRDPRRSCRQQRLYDGSPPRPRRPHTAARRGIMRP